LVTPASAWRAGRLRNERIARAGRLDESGQHFGSWTI
jgi:hypothetical protein